MLFFLINLAELAILKTEVESMSSELEVEEPALRTSFGLLVKWVRLREKLKEVFYEASDSKVNLEGFDLIHKKTCTNIYRVVNLLLTGTSVKENEEPDRAVFQKIDIKLNQHKHQETLLMRQINTLERRKSQLKDLCAPLLLVG